MTELKLTVSIDAPALAAALDKLAAAISHNTPCVTAAQPAQQVPPAKIPAAPAPVMAPITSPIPAAPIAPPVVPAVSVAPTAPTVPTGAPTYSLEQLATAGSTLLDAGKADLLIGLLSKYGVDSITKLAPEQYGAFATDLRALGAQI